MNKAQDNIFKERVFALAVELQGHRFEEVANSLEELERLIETDSGTVVESIVIKRKEPSPAMFIGKGKAEELRGLLSLNRCTLLAIDHELTGSQQKNLEKCLDCRVIDRTGIILDIFSKHARTKEAKNQVELASLEYLASRLTRRWTHLERQRGGIGLRGLGERQIELDRRQIRGRIAKLKSTLSHSADERAVQRSHRDQFLRVALVGYTNAGKSTIMNALTKNQMYVDDRLFATLDSTVRMFDPKTRPPILLSDTVGFINKLPHSLVASFRATLQEVVEADLLLHVIDLSSSYYTRQMEVTQDVLGEIGAATRPTLLVFNKADKVKEFFLPKIVERTYIDSLVVSAFNSDDMLRLREAISKFFDQAMVEMVVSVPYEKRRLQSQIFEQSKVLDTEYREDEATFRIRVMKSTADRLKLKDYERGDVYGD